MKVKHFMVPSTKVVSVPSTSTLKDVADGMVKHKVGSVIILGANGEPAGILTTKDMVRVGFLEGKGASTPVTEVMTKNLVYIHEDTERDEVANQMIKAKLHHLLVRNSGKHFVGLVTTLDVVHEAALDAKAFPYNRSMFYD